MGNALQIAPSGERSIRITRTFNAPRELVFDAMSRPDMMKQWFHGPKDWRLTFCEIDLRAGGKYRWVCTNGAGEEMGIGGAYIEVKRPERIVSTELFDEPWYAGEALVTIEFTEKGKTTVMTMTILYPTMTARDSSLASPMASGMEALYSNLDTYLTTQ